MESKDLVKSKNFRRGIEIVIAVLVMLVVFGAGVFVGLEKAEFSYRWGENYFRNFTGPRPFFADRGYMNAHGISGLLLKIDGNNLAVKDSDGDENNILIDNQTLIKKGPGDLSPSQLKAGDFIVAIGSPDSQGQILARLVRIMPGPPPANH